jgi:hypothetical protein
MGPRVLDGGQDFDALQPRRRQVAALQEMYWGHY